MNTSICTDPELKAQAVPLDLSLNPPQALYADLMHAESERAAGYQGRTGDEVLSEMRQIISDANGKT